MCVSPVIAWQELKAGAKLVFTHRQPFSPARKFVLPCGKCIECRRAQVNEWAIRCLCESSLHKKNCVLTLTYNDENLPPQLVKRDYQNFLKSLRQEVGQIRYFLSGEYGEKKVDRIFMSSFSVGVPKMLYSLRKTAKGVSIAPL